MLQFVKARGLRLFGAGSFCAVSLISGAPSVNADKFHVTEEERSACTIDAERPCASTYPDEDRLLDCMMASKKEINRALSRCFQKRSQAARDPVALASLDLSSLAKQPDAFVDLRQQAAACSMGLRERDA